MLGLNVGLFILRRCIPVINLIPFELRKKATQNIVKNFCFKSSEPASCEFASCKCTSLRVASRTIFEFWAASLAICWFRATTRLILSVSYKLWVNLSASCEWCISVHIVSSPQMGEIKTNKVMKPYIMYTFQNILQSINCSNSS